MRVYMKEKPVKWGIKLYELCESWSDYEWDFEIMAHEPGLSNAPFDICQRLIHSLKNAGYTLFIHNFYCNPALCDALAADTTMVVGTVPANPIGLPKDLIQQPMNKGDMDFRRKNQLVAIRWKDKRDVHQQSNARTHNTYRNKTKTHNSY